MLLFSSAYNEYTVISKEYIGPLDVHRRYLDALRGPRLEEVGNHSYN